MKINRQPVEEMTDEIISKDHEFWSKYSERLIGNWITYDTPISNICAFAERVYLRRDFTGFTGDRKFVRDDQAQKSFSKLRSSIGGLYAWRVNAAKTPAEQQRLLKEADFTLRQAFAFCPYSPEAVIRYVNLLASPGINRLQDALLVAQTCEKFDPYNVAMKSLVSQLENLVKGRPAVDQVRQQVSQLEQQYRSNPMDVQNAFNLAGAYFQMQQTSAGMQVLNQLIAQLNQLYRTNPTNLQNALTLATVYIQVQQTNLALPILEQLLTNSQSDGNTLLQTASLYAQLGHLAPLEAALSKIVTVMPNNPEAWYDLAGVQAKLGKNQLAVASLDQAVKLSQERLAQQPNAKNLAQMALTNEGFNSIRHLPEFQKAVRRK